MCLADILFKHCAPSTFNSRTACAQQRDNVLDRNVAVVKKTISRNIDDNNCLWYKLFFRAHLYSILQVRLRSRSPSVC